MQLNIIPGRVVSLAPARPLSIRLAKDIIRLFAYEFWDSLSDVQTNVWLREPSALFVELRALHCSETLPPDNFRKCLVSCVDDLSHLHALYAACSVFCILFRAQIP